MTKSIEAYVGLPINGQSIDLLDTQGIGDTDVTPMKLLTLLLPDPQDAKKADGRGKYFRLHCKKTSS